MSDELWDGGQHFPVDDVVADALTDTYEVTALVDETLADLPVDASTGLSSEISATLSFLNDGGAVVNDLIDTASGGEALDPEQVDAANRIIERGANLPFWEHINHTTEVSNDIRRDDLDRSWREDLDRRDAEARHQLEHNDDVVADAEHELRWGW